MQFERRYLYMTKLFVICGHGAGDSGACGNGYQEAERVRVLGKKIKELGGSNVTLGDVNRNYYADKGISSLTISKYYQIIELHMDSAVSTARGGHVVIWGNFEPDKYDEALAKFICGMFPGRSVQISKRTDLANPARAAHKGYGYRLVECGFISNKQDLELFNSSIEEIAKGILNCFGIKTSTSTESKPSISKPSTSTGGSSSSGSITVGDKVKLSANATKYATGETIPAQYKGKTYTVMQLGSGKVLLKELYSWVYTKDVSKTSSGSTASSKSYFPKCSANETSIIDYMKEKCGYKNPTFADQTKIAKANGISNYTGTAAQNIKLLDLAKQGKLIKP